MAMGQAGARCLRRDSAFWVPAARLRCGYRGGGDVRLVQRAVGGVAGAVGVVWPRRVGDAAVERQARVVAMVDPVPGIAGAGGSGADVQAGGEAGAAVGAERPPELG